MKNLKLFLSIFILSLIANFSNAQETTTKKGVNPEIIELRQSFNTLQKDKAELKDFNYQISRLEAAFEDKDVESIQLIQKKLKAAIQREIEQNQNKSEGYSLQKQRKILDELQDFDFAEFSTNQAHAEENLNLLKMFSMGMEADISITEKSLDQKRKELRQERKNNSN